jgi:peroxiredoxin
LHCPICKLYLRQLDSLLEPFARRGTDVIAVSCDDRARADRTVRDWELKSLRIGYGLTIEEARGWDLFISNAIKEGEPAQFSEPGLALVKADGTLYAISLQSMPFARPHFNDVLNALDFVIQENYPARGEA